MRGKTVAIKLNMTGPANDKLNSMPNQMTHWVHPQVIGALVYLLGQGGARRIRLLESAPVGTKPLEEFMLSAGWQPKDFAGAATRVEFENTNFLGSGKTYARFMVPGGGTHVRGLRPEPLLSRTATSSSRWPSSSSTAPPASRSP